MLKFSAKSIKLVIFLLVVFTATSFGQGDQLKDDLKESFRKFDVVRIDTQQTFADSGFGATLNLRAEENDFELVLQANELRAASYHAEDTSAFGTKVLDRGQVLIFKGFVNGIDGSTVRINLNGEKLEGYFVSDGARYYIETARNYSSNADERDYIIYTAGAYLGDDDFDCQTDMMKRIDDGKKSVSPQKIANLEGRGVLELATDADFQFVSEMGGATAANNEILYILNLVDGVFEEQLDINIQVVFQHTWTSADTYNGANTIALAQSFKDHWNANYPLNEYPRDAAHLFSSKSGVASQGYAYIGAVCQNPPFAYGVSGRVSFAHGRLLLTSHELAHGVGGNHVDTSSCSGTIMNATLNGAAPLEFCQASVSEIRGFMETSGGCLAPPAVAATRFDFDGDSKTDTAIFRPSLGQWWYLRSSDGNNRAFQFGIASDQMVPADYTGDGRTDIAFWRESTGEAFVLRSEDSTFYGFPFGAAGDIPAPADYDGDGIDDFAVFRPAATTWYVLNSTGGISIRGFGGSNDIPVVNDYDGDGFADLAIFRPDVQEWWINKSTEGLSILQFGAAGDKPTPADYTGDGKTDVAFYRPATGEWFVVRSEDNSFYSAPFGASGDIAAPGDYDGDGTADLAIWRPGDRTWYVLGSQNGFFAVGFGSAGDVPVPSAYIP